MYERWLQPEMYRAYYEKGEIVVKTYRKPTYVLEGLLAPSVDTLFSTKEAAILELVARKARKAKRAEEKLLAAKVRSEAVRHAAKKVLDALREDDVPSTALVLHRNGERSNG